MSALSPGRAELVQKNASTIRTRWGGMPRVAIVLGSGLGELADKISAELVVPYHELDGFPVSTALGHQGQFVCGSLEGVQVIAMQGRCHLYEGYSFEQVVHPVRVMQTLGAKLLIVSNASGGLNPRFAGGDIMLLDGHINLMWRIGMMVDAQSSTSPGCRRGTSPYDPFLTAQALEIARRENFTCHRGVYVAVSGPSYETRAEYRFLRHLGDAAGMSTVPEVLVAAEGGMRVLAVSVITNVARPDAPAKTEAQEVVNVAAAAATHLEKIVTGVCRGLPATGDQP